MYRQVAFSLSCFLLLTGARPTTAIEVQPHRAIYRMLLAKSDRPSDVIAAEGVMLYRFARGCDGWTVENKTVLRLNYDNEVATDTVWSFVSWESMDGRQFRFHARYDQDGRKVEKLSGRADFPAAGKPGIARFFDPEERTLPLPAGTLFPTHHMQEVLAEAMAGRHHLTRLVFDGASVDNPYQVSARFGPRPDAAAESLAQAAGLPKMPVWWTRMAFFPESSTEEVPEFEIDAEYRADGIADHITQQFEHFALDVRLKELQVLPAPDC
jgi:Domain of unknown function (DUF1849).